jgi:hypothetical protein
VKQKLQSPFAAIRVCPAHRDYWRCQPHPEEWLLIEWQTGESEPTKYWIWFRCELHCPHSGRVEVHADQHTQSVQGAPVPGRSDRFVRALVSPVSALLGAHHRTGG